MLGRVGVGSLRRGSAGEKNITSLCHRSRPSARQGTGLARSSRKGQARTEGHWNRALYDRRIQIWPCPSAEKIVGDFCLVQILEHFAGDFPGGFFWALFPKYK